MQNRIHRQLYIQIALPEIRVSPSFDALHFLGAHLETETAQFRQKRLLFVVFSDMPRVEEDVLQMTLPLKVRLEFRVIHPPPERLLAIENVRGIDEDVDATGNELLDHGVYCSRSEGAVEVEVLPCSLMRVQ